MFEKLYLGSLYLLGFLYVATAIYAYVRWE